MTSFLVTHQSADFTFGFALLNGQDAEAIDRGLQGEGAIAVSQQVQTIQCVGTARGLA